MLASMKLHLHLSSSLKTRNVMAAGITVPYDNLGLQTADLIVNQWPLRAGEVRPKEYTALWTAFKSVS